MITYSLSTDMRPAPGSAPTPEHYDRVIELVRAAEGLGYRTVWTSEQHGVDDGYLPAPLTALAALARETSTIRLGTGITLLTLAQPRRLAQEAGLLDVLSRGRLTPGFGAGHHPHEFRAYQRELAERARLMDEGVAFVRAALTGPTAPDGRYLPGQSAADEVARVEPVFAERGAGVVRLAPGRVPQQRHVGGAPGGAGGAEQPGDVRRLSLGIGHPGEELQRGADQRGVVEVAGQPQEPGDQPPRAGHVAGRAFQVGEHPHQIGLDHNAPRSAVCSMIGSHSAMPASSWPAAPSAPARSAVASHSPTTSWVCR